MAVNQVWISGLNQFYFWVRRAPTWLLWMEMAQASFNGSCCRLRYTPPTALNVQRSRFITSTAPHRKRTLGRPDGQSQIQDTQTIRLLHYKISPRTAGVERRRRTFTEMHSTHDLQHKSPEIYKTPKYKKVSVTSSVMLLSENNQ